MQVVPEKSFIQKYWIYILVGVGALRKFKATKHGSILTWFQFCQAVLRTRNPNRLQKQSRNFPYACYNPSGTIYNGSGACPITVTSRPFYRRNTAPFKLRLWLMVYFISKEDSLHSTRIRVIRLPYLPPNGSSRLFRWRSTRIWQVSRSILQCPTEEI